jgi:hypothetical protein
MERTETKMDRELLEALRRRAAEEGWRTVMRRGSKPAECCGIG